MSRTTWTCATCGETFKAWATAERHANGEHHGGRITINVPRRRP